MFSPWNQSFGYPTIGGQCKSKGFHREHSMEEICEPNNPVVASRVHENVVIKHKPFLHFEVTCDDCKCKVRGIHYQCNDCSNYALCSQCKAEGIHSEHSMKKIQQPNDPAVVGRVKIPIASADQQHGLDDPFITRWSPAESGKAFRRKAVSSLHQEYKAVIANMKAAGGQEWAKKVKQICRIENHRMYKIYKSCKEEMERENGPGFQNERILWHGTSAEVLSNIYRDGFNRSYCGKNATAFGDGVYFATFFEYSALPTYSPQDSRGRKYIFQRRVLTGHFTKGQKEIKEPPMRTRELRYDSVVDKVTDPKMFVIFKDMQVYPAYVITLEL